MSASAASHSRRPVRAASAVGRAASAGGGAASAGGGGASDGGGAASAGGGAASAGKKRQGAGSASSSKKRQRQSAIDDDEQEELEAASLKQALKDSTPFEPEFDEPEQSRPSGLLSVSSGHSSVNTTMATRPSTTSSNQPRPETRKLYARSQRRETLMALRALADALEHQEAAMVNSRSSTVVLDGDEYMPDYSNLRIPSLESVRDLLGLSDSSPANTEAYIDFRESDMDPRLRAAMLSLETAAATGKAHRIACATRKLQHALHRRVLETKKVQAAVRRQMLPPPEPTTLVQKKARPILLR